MSNDLLLRLIDTMMKLKRDVLLQRLNNAQIEMNQFDKLPLFSKV